MCMQLTASQRCSVLVLPIVGLMTQYDNNISLFRSCFRPSITGSASSAVALHRCKAHAKINRKMGNSTPPRKMLPLKIPS